MFKYYSSYALVFSNLTHLLCCGIPLLIGISSIFTNIVYLEYITLNIELLESAEVYLFTLTTLIFLLLISLEIYNKKIKCADENQCCEVDKCDSTKRKIKFNIILSCILYTFNTSVLLSEIIT